MCDILDHMNEVQQQLQALYERGWTIPAIARSIGMSASAVEKWRAGDRTPRAQKLLIAALEDLLRKKRIPKRRVSLPKERQPASGGSRMTASPLLELPQNGFLRGSQVFSSRQMKLLNLEGVGR